MAQSAWSRRGFPDAGDDRGVGSPALIGERPEAFSRAPKTKPVAWQGHGLLKRRPSGVNRAGATPTRWLESTSPGGAVHPELSLSLSTIFALMDPSSPTSP